MHSMIANGDGALIWIKLPRCRLRGQAANGARRDCGAAFRAAAAGGVAQVIHERREIGTIAI